MKKRNVGLAFLMGCIAVCAQAAVVRDIPISSQKKINDDYLQ